MSKSNKKNDKTNSIDSSNVKDNNNQLINYIFYLVAIFFFIYVLRYYFTGAGGPTLLIVSMLPVAYILATLDAMRKGDFYPGLNKNLRYVLGVIFILISLVAAIYVTKEFNAIRIVRLAIWNTTDMVIGTLMVLLIMEYARRKILPIFILNIILILYSVYGWIIPGMFRHPGLRWYRVLSSLSMEMTTGIYSQLPQLALTLILPFMMVLAVLRGFGCIDSILKWTLKLSTKSIHAIPQSAVIGSFAVAAVSGSGPANAATTGSITIPALIQAGFSRVNAAAIETATSLGGQLMPPVMGVAAFIMVEFLGVSYFDIVARGFGPALVYYFGVGFAVYLLTFKFVDKMANKQYISNVEIPKLGFLDKASILAFVGIIVSLIYLMGRYMMEPMIAALRVFIGLTIFLLLVMFYQFLIDRRYQIIKEIIKNFKNLIDAFTDLSADLVILLSLLGILAGILTITGIPPKIGRLLIGAANFHVIAAVGVTFIFGYVLGMGLPPAPVYTMVALATAPTLIRLGLDRWSVHFFAFFLGILGHLSPPTSLTAAVTSKIAGSNYTRTIFKSLIICIPLLLLMPAVFTRPELVTTLGLLQLHSFLLVLSGTLGIVFCFHCKFSKIKYINNIIKLFLLIFSLISLYHPNISLANISILPIVIVVIYGFVRTIKLGND